MKDMPPKSFLVSDLSFRVPHPCFRSLRISDTIHGLIWEFRNGSGILLVTLTSDITLGTYDKFDCLWEDYQTLNMLGSKL